MKVKKPRNDGPLLERIAKSKAAACKTAEEAWELFLNAPLFSQAGEIFKARMKELQPLEK